ncbi:regulator of cell morphogenesis and NO signaling [Chitinophaga japonensis]|uniref:Regulator of cell morphogenesis and NO signaling n=1 Tax=Chitinophaga japonensis TaxID=104662 RepID=A0A562SMM3_CHIJA|nr:regulator of cell morphogenesis and NO signaling [Chitinophaga japonensis]
MGGIVAENIRNAEVLRAFGIDFCCGGRKTLEDACREKALDIDRVRQALAAAADDVSGIRPDFSAFTPSFLADYIVNVHHAYVRQHIPVILDLAEKVAVRHGAAHPFLHEINSKANELAQELLTHMKKEEQVLFPAIKLLDSGHPLKVGFATISIPIEVMESDHDLAGDLVKDIRLLSGDYTAPEGACNSMKLLYHKLEAFEHDLHLHIHLENNILFPKAMQQERALHAGITGSSC